MKKYSELNDSALINLKILKRKNKKNLKNKANILLNKRKEIKDSTGMSSEEKHKMLKENSRYLTANNIGIHNLKNEIFEIEREQRKRNQ